MAAHQGGSSQRSSLEVRLNTSQGRGSAGDQTPRSNDTSSGTSIVESVDAQDGGAVDNKRSEKPEADHVSKKKEILGNTPFAAKIVNNKYFIIFTTVLTTYALTGDDMRVYFTNKPADYLFVAMVILCISVFTLEVVLSCLGKRDYFLGFFFMLDVVSTASLILDIPAVAEEVTNLFSGSDDNASNVRSGKAAVLGARVGRVVRVIRLIRLVKLYKAAETARENRANSRMRAGRGDDDDDWETGEALAPGEDAEATRDNPTSETRVGRKLSEMTTRRVILLILAMMLVMPNLDAEEANQTPVSPLFGANWILENFKHKLNSNSSGSPHSELFALRYERALLQYVYYHNWFAQHDEQKYCSRGPCANAFYGQLFWLGLRGRNKQMLQDMVGQSKLRPATVDAWTQEMANAPGWGFYNYGTMPPEAATILKSDWTDCGIEGEARIGLSLIGDPAGDTVNYHANCPEDLRFSEIVIFYSQFATQLEFDSWHFAFFFDLRPYTRAEALFNLGTTLFILVLLLYGSIMFSHDANKLVLDPVEKMIQRVEAIRENPMILGKMADDMFKAEEVAKALAAKDKGQWAKKLAKDLLVCDCVGSRGDQVVMETVILEKTIIKLGSLLVLGFGEAGARIIGHNLSGTGSAKINAMVPGVRINCIIGVARVRDFGIATQVLQANIMTFANQIAEIVHGIANEFNGAPNKNNGNFFLIIWRVDEAMPENTPKMAEMAVVAFTTILAAVQKSKVLADTFSHPGLQLRWASLKRNGRVNLSFGLHAGWAIEGAVGTEFKIDASYLSPNVNIAKSVERATEMYDVSLMVAQSVVDLCTTPMAEKCRLIDRVVIAGQSVPIDLYCVDLDYMAISPEPDGAVALQWNAKQRFKARQYMECCKAGMWGDDACPTTKWVVVLEQGCTIWKDKDERNSIGFKDRGVTVDGNCEGNWLNLNKEKGYLLIAKGGRTLVQKVTMSDIFDGDPDIRRMRKRYTTKFFQLFNMGYQNYLQGEWQCARIFLSMSRQNLAREDGPSQALMRYMAEHNFKAPENWQKTPKLLGQGISDPESMKPKRPTMTQLC